ncbi:hypothetical protein HDU67_007138 [Dinochytrium kinnereticum]|nr:hypothetical protein HDU67_007138 [Dinochytrium kinnereticum]
MQLRNCSLTAVSLFVALVAALALVVGLPQSATSEPVALARTAQYYAKYVRRASEPADANVVALDKREPVDAVVDVEKRSEDEIPQAQVVRRCTATKKNKKAGAKNRKAERTAAYKRNIQTKKDMKASKAGKKANAAISKWINSGATPAEKLAKKQAYRNFMKHLKPVPATPAHGGHRYDEAGMKVIGANFPGSQATNKLGGGRYKMKIKGGGKKGKDQIKSVFLNPGNYGKMGIAGMPDKVSARQGYTAAKANFMNRQAFAHALKSGKGVYNVEQPNGKSTIPMQVYPPAAAGGGGVGTAYPVRK